MQSNENIFPIINIDCILNKKPINFFDYKHQIIRFGPLKIFTIIILKGIIKCILHY